MKKNIFLLPLALLALSGQSIGQSIQPCSTYDMRDKYLEEFPQIAQYEKQLEKDIQTYISRQHDMNKLSRKTAEGHQWDDWYDIPLVVHVVHDYGPELLVDNKIYELVAEMNRFYSNTNNVSGVIKEFKPYIGNPKIRFHLATKDPSGKPTKGITHKLSYLTKGGDDQGKFDQWNPANYINIWFENTIGAKPANGIIVAYATPPSTAAAAPYRDGIISNYSFIDDGVRDAPSATGGSIDHEMGHILNLSHTFGTTNNPGTNKSGSCTDDDAVDDTPPTQGHLGGCPLYDSVCATNYFKIYSGITGADSLVNYPDTANEQNIMNYADCKVNLTKGQVERMRGALNSDVGKRDSLWSPYNLFLTGALDPIPDLAPIADFVVKNNVNANTYFTCSNNGSTSGAPLKFINYSWQDTVVAINWTFTNGASTPTASASVAANSATNVSSSVTNTFDTPGWVTVTLAATGNHSGLTTTTEFPRAVFVADKEGTQANNYMMEFNTPDTAKWPLFNYYNNEFKWKYANVGMYDNSSLEYTGFDTRGFTTTGSPLGDYDDVYSAPMDLTGFGTGPCNLNYFYSAAARTSNAYDINDRLEIFYSTDRATSWKQLDTMVKGRLVNKGAIYTAYTPANVSDWAPMSINIPAAARTAYTVFRFRYKPSLSVSARTGVIEITGGSYSTGNNFYMDRIHFSAFPAEASLAQLANLNVKVVPNPTSGDAFVIIKDAGNSTANVIVSDITGKQVYTTTQHVSGSETSIQIPREAISVAGMYLVQTTTGTQTSTQKLVVY